jgi:molecular chaperone GrpE
MSNETPNPAAADEVLAAAPEAAQQENSQQSDSATKELQAALEEANGRALKAIAELDNYRKRVRRELEDERKYAPLPLVSDLLSSIDNLDRAVNSVAENEANKGLLDGVKMVLGQLISTLEKHNCRRIQTDGQQFDPHVHEAIAQEPSDLEPGMIVREVASGFMLHDRVVRPARVTVAVAKPESN